MVWMWAPNKKFQGTTQQIYFKWRNIGNNGKTWYWYAQNSKHVEFQIY